jgi:hypothetical protein
MPISVITRIWSFLFLWLQEHGHSYICDYKDITMHFHMNLRALPILLQL